MKRLTATDIARGLSEVLNRVEYREEEFEVERNGRVIARIVPSRALSRLSELAEALSGAARDLEFAEDLEQIQAEQPAIPAESAWDS